MLGAPWGRNKGGSNTPHNVHAIRVAATHPSNVGNGVRVAATHPSNIGNGMRVAATHPSNNISIGNGMRVAATHPSNNISIGNGMRVAATHPSNEQCSEGGSNTPCTVTDKAMSEAHPHPGVTKLRCGGGPTQPAMRR